MRTHPRMIIGQFALALASLTLLAGCGSTGGEVKIPEKDPAVVEANRQSYEQMARQERMNQ
jgi:predicted small lipoprotein YifL